MSAGGAAVTRVLVLGGHGFIGRHAVASLQAAGAEVVIGTRNPGARTAQVAEIQCRLEKMLNVSDWLALAEGFDAILNCVGILRPWAGATYDRIHHLAPAAVAQATAQRNIRFIHVSALGLDRNNRSGFLLSKLDGEIAIREANPESILVRPSLLDGDGGYGAAWLRGVARLPLFVTPADAQGRIAALWVTDLGEALARLSMATADALDLQRSRDFELGGSRAYRFVDYIRGLRRRSTLRPAIAIPLPGVISRLGAHICDLLRMTPFSFGHWELLRKDNRPKPNRLRELLGRAPQEVVPDK